MNLNQINTQAFRTICTLVCAFLLLGSYGMVTKHLYYKGIIGFITAPIIVWIAFMPASYKSWALLIFVFLLAMYIIGATGNHLYVPKTALIP